MKALQVENMILLSCNNVSPPIDDIEWPLVRTSHSHNCKSVSNKHQNNLSASACTGNKRGIVRLLHVCQANLALPTPLPV